MNYKIISKNFLTLLITLLFTSNAFSQTLFNDGWQFKLDTSTKWENVSLPHTAHIEPLVVNNQWQGICYYRKTFDIENYSSDKLYFLKFEAAMNKADIWLNGKYVLTHQGGFLPIIFNATPYLNENNNQIELRLDNNDNPVTGPKPVKILDFNTYGGLYRNAYIITKNRIHITSPLLAAESATGGVFITTPKVSEDSSIVRIKTQIKNESSANSKIKVVHKIYRSGLEVKQCESALTLIAAGATGEFVENIEIAHPDLWSPDEPNLYTVKTVVLSGGQEVDTEKSHFGIREFEYKNHNIYINGVKTFLRGVNRHQEYPFIGYALSDNAQCRDAVKIKKAGFNYVRLSHYPQSPAFMDACDSLGIVVVDAMLGWQYYKENSAFKNQCYHSARQLIRRDRNHPCVFGWEVSLNETKMPNDFMAKLNSIVHEEYPGPNVYSCGWIADEYDVYFQSRQHRIMHPEAITFEKPYIVSEYGDWEYYSNNSGLNQDKLSRTKRLELSSRQPRSAGEKSMLIQAHNIQESHNDNLSMPAAGDGYWVMFDYNRGYHPDIEYSGIMDIFRLPKLSFYFYASQADARKKADASYANVVLKIASFWTPESPKDVKVFSNCDRVKLYLNGRKVGDQTPDKDSISDNLNHSPFTFHIKKFKAGTLKAVGYISGKKVKTDIVRSPKTAKKLICWIDESGVKPKAGRNDVVFAYIAAVDSNGTICHDFDGVINLKTDSKVEILNPGEIKTEFGIATALLKIDNQSGNTNLEFSSEGLKGSSYFNIEK
ncbi:MAG: glycoside hydrolase family 2 TIM barrel-domain containing protein [Bacteroidales bacterium]